MHNKCISSWPKLTAGKLEAPLLQIKKNKIRVYMIKRVTGEHRNDFKTSEKYASTWNVSVVWE